MSADGAHASGAETGAWRSVLPLHEREVLARAGFGARAGLGTRPALLVVDVTYGFCGLPGETLLESVDRWRTGCGPVAWEAVGQIERLLAAARAAAVPVTFTAPWRAGEAADGRWASKNRRRKEAAEPLPKDPDAIVDQLTPRAGEVVVRKAKPSAFFGSPLASLLIDRGVDTLLVAGATTSGCVRATVVDAFSLNYRVGVVEDATFDRSPTSHNVSLSDMHAKYADVVTVAAALRHLAGPGAPGAQEPAAAPAGDGRGDG